MLTSLSEQRKFLEVYFNDAATVSVGANEWEKGGAYGQLRIAGCGPTSLLSRRRAWLIAGVRQPQCARHSQGSVAKGQFSGSQFWFEVERKRRDWRQRR